MTLRIRPKLVILSVGIIGLSVLTVYLYLSHALEQHLAERIQEDLTVRLRLAARTASRTEDPWSALEQWDALAGELSALTHARVSLISPDGAVVGDSAIARDALATTESHARRPEVLAALADGRGASSRMSATLEKRMLYVAMPLAGQGRKAGVVRLAMPLDEIDEVLARLRWILAVSALLAFGVASVVAGLAAHLASRPLRQLTDAARRMGRGDMSIRTHIQGHDEVAELGHALDQLASNLSTSLNELRGERDLLSRILHSKQEGVLVIGRDGRIVMVNQALRAMLLLPTDIVSRPLDAVIRHIQLIDLLERARTAGEPISVELELAGLKPRRLIIRAATLSGEPGGLVAVFIDVTNIRRLESLRRDFVANASHELRTPVAAIRSAGETLQQGALEDLAAAARFVSIINRNAERLHNLMDDLLDLSRIESREFHLDLEPLALDGVVEQVCAIHKEAAERKAIRLTAAVPAEAPPVLADRRALDQILTNLVDNAIKYCGDKATVKLSARARSGEVALTVEDTGPGIEAKHLPRLFERFYRVDTGRSRDLGGTGLGLSIVKHLAEAMEGSIEVESAPGKGTVFTLTLPQGRSSSVSSLG